MIGNLTLRERNRRGEWMRINARDDVGDSGYGVPYNVEAEKIELLEHDIDFIMAIETGGMFDRLIENGFDEEYRCGLIAPQGATCSVDSTNHEAYERRMGFTSRCLPRRDPWSFRIFASIAYGAIKTAHISEYLATPSATYLGITADDIVAYDLPSDDLSKKDIEALNAELTDPRFADGWWQEQINMMLELGKKAEQQSLAKYGFDFVTETYFRRSSLNSVWLEARIHWEEG